MLDPDSPLYRMRHSAAHVLATAVCRLFDDVQLDIGPPTEDGFYYDFDLPHRFTPEDFERIEAEMNKIIAEDQAFERSEVSREEAIKLIHRTCQDNLCAGSYCRICGFGWRIHQPELE